MWWDRSNFWHRNTLDLVLCMHSLSEAVSGRHMSEAQGAHGSLLSDLGLLFGCLEAPYLGLNTSSWHYCHGPTAAAATASTACASESAGVNSVPRSDPRDSHKGPGSNLSQSTCCPLHFGKPECPCSGFSRPSTYLVWSFKSSAPQIQCAPVPPSWRPLTTTTQRVKLLSEAFLSQCNMYISIYSKE